MEPAPDRTSTRARARNILGTSGASAAIVGLVSAVTVSTSVAGAPGLGILVAMLTLGVVLWLRGGGLRGIGFTRPTSWTKILVLGALLGTLIQLASVTLIDPFIELVTGTPIDLSQFDEIRGNLGALLTWLLVVWVLVVFVEEMIFRGFLMTELKKVLGEHPLPLFANLMLTSVLFGLAHGYQGPSGVLSTGFIGLLLGLIFVRNGFNLWLPIFVHGVIDTVGLTMIYLNVDVNLTELW